MAEILKVKGANVRHVYLQYWTIPAERLLLNHVLVLRNAHNRKRAPGAEYALLLRQGSPFLPSLPFLSSRFQRGLQRTQCGKTCRQGKSQFLRLVCPGPKIPQPNTGTEKGSGKSRGRKNCL